VSDVTSSTMYKLALELVQKVSAIQVGLPAGVFGNNSTDKKASQDLVKSASELVRVIAGDGSSEAMQSALDGAAQSINTCFLLGVFSDNELKKYQILTDGIHAELEKE
jgi:hypothetical protein